MSTKERRMRIIEKLCKRRFDTMLNLSIEFNVTKRTIENDIAALSLEYPIYTVSGNRGGVHVVEGYYLNKKYLSNKQVKILVEISVTLKGERLKILKTILRDFAKPNTYMENK